MLSLNQPSTCGAEGRLPSNMPVNTNFSDGSNNVSSQPTVSTHCASLGSGTMMSAHNRSAKDNASGALPNCSAAMLSCARCNVFTHSAHARAVIWFSLDANLFCTHCSSCPHRCPSGNCVLAAGDMHANHSCTCVSSARAKSCVNSLALTWLHKCSMEVALQSTAIFSRV